jgi:hypothetical protein
MTENRYAKMTATKRKKRKTSKDGISRMLRVIDELHNKHGYYYEKWKAGYKAAAERIP